jgi:hypothetical protein
MILSICPHSPNFCSLSHTANVRIETAISALSLTGLTGVLSSLTAHSHHRGLAPGKQVSCTAQRW